MLYYTLFVQRIGITKTFIYIGNLVIFRVAFDAKMTFEKHLRSVSRAAAQRLIEL